MKQSVRTLGLATIMLGTTAAVASELYSVRFPAATDLYRVNQTSGAISLVGPSGQDGIGDLTSDTRAPGGAIWGVRVEENRLYQFDPVSGVAAAGALLNSPDDMVSLAFDPVGGKLYGNTAFGFGAPFDALYEINPVTGNCTFIGRILFENVYALGFDQVGNLFGIADTSNQFISINTTTGNGSLIANLPLGFSYDLASRPEDNTMFLADSGTVALYTIDTATGVTTPVGPYGANENLVGLAFLTIPEPSSWIGAGVLGGVAFLIRFWRRRSLV